MSSPAPVKFVPELRKTAHNPSPTNPPACSNKLPIRHPRADNAALNNAVAVLVRVPQIVDSWKIEAVEAIYNSILTDN